MFFQKGDKTAMSFQAGFQERNSCSEFSDDDRDNRYNAITEEEDDVVGGFIKPSNRILINLI